MVDGYGSNRVGMEQSGVQIAEQMELKAVQLVHPSFLSIQVGSVYKIYGNHKVGMKLVCRSSWCSGAGLERCGVGGTEVLAKLCNISLASADVWLDFVEKRLDLTLHSKLSGSVVGSCHEKVDLDEAIEEGTSKSVDTLNHVLREAFSSS